MRLICRPNPSLNFNNTDKFVNFGVSKSGNNYTVNNLDYKIYKVSDASDILIDTSNGLTKNNNNDTLSYFYNYQIIKIPYNEFSFDNNTTTTYKIIPSFSSGNILEGQTNPPTLTDYLVGGCFSNSITNSINYLSSNVNNDYTVTQIFPSATASTHIGTVQPLSSGLILKFNKNEVKLMKDDTTYIAVGNVKSDGNVYSYGTIQNVFGNINRTWDNSNWPNDARIISSKPQSKTFTTSFEKYTGYKIKATKENKNEVKIVGDFKFTFSGVVNQINETTLIQNGNNSPEVNSIKSQSSSAISTVTPTKPYAVFHAIIPYSFINMFPHFYNNNNLALTGDANITININNNGLILYVPMTFAFCYRYNYEVWRSSNQSNIDVNVIRKVTINFSGVGIVTVATTSKNSDVISDEVDYGIGGLLLDTERGRGTLYRNGNNTGKYATKILVDNSSLSIKMIDFFNTYTFKDTTLDKVHDYWYQPRLYVDDVV